MSLFDMLRQEYVKGRVVEEYRLGNGDVGLINEGDLVKLIVSYSRDPLREGYRILFVSRRD